ncbi:tubby-like protein 8 isoform X2 [Prosopis cineraria]|uniref:tubby-like protein 8 isoform X2 n=1 Tax=Prosopis cineraria TaxID=364024 RepID=UPI00240F6818|nr:tubby-like protein 8 isoform X2 [Prosopis cineraria]
MSRMTLKSSFSYLNSNPSLVISFPKPPRPSFYQELKFLSCKILQGLFLPLSAMSDGCKKSSILGQSYNSLYVNPLTEFRHSRSCSDSVRLASKCDKCEDFTHRKVATDNKENVTPKRKDATLFCDKENAVPTNGPSSLPKHFSKSKSLCTDRILKPNSLQFCMQMNEPEKAFGSKIWDNVHFENMSSLKIWDYSDSEAAPASSWSTLPNKSLICRSLPIDIGRCTCLIVKEAKPEGLSGGTMFSLYTYEGQGRQNRKLAVAYHKRRNGRSQFIVAHNVKGLLSNSDDSFLGTVTANLLGSKYRIWDQGFHHNLHDKQSKPPLAVVMFIPTAATCTGSYRSMRAYVPKHQSMSLKSTAQVQHIKGLPMDWEGKLDKVHQLFSRVPLYNKTSKQFELDFKDKGRAGLRIQRSVKNFQLTLENGKQTILQLGRVEKSKFVMDYRYPLTGYQAFCLSLASIDTKLCCSV